MLDVTIPSQDLFDERSETFIHIEKCHLQLEHSLVALHKWESKWHEPFLGTTSKTKEQIDDYIRCMTLNKDVDPIIYQYIPSFVLKEILKYMKDPMTATWFSNPGNSQSMTGRKEVITAEIIYYWMITLGIPVKFEEWHLQQLLTLIRVINVKNAPSKKMNKKDILARNRQLNAARRAKNKSKG